MQYRELAKNLRQNPEQATYRGPKKREYHVIGQIQNKNWGHVPDKFGRGEIVWSADIAGYDDKAVVAAIYPKIRFEDVREWGYLPIVAVGTFLTSVSVVCIYSVVRLDLARDNFMAAAVHDLRTPLAAMKMMIGRNDAEAKIINERMLRIVANISDFLALGGGRRQPKCVAFDVSRIYREAYALFAEDFAAEKSGPVKVELPALTGMVPMVIGDDMMTLQIIWNLLGNELKYAAGFGEITVKFSPKFALHAQKQRILIDFIDNGHGMTRFQRFFAFNRYYRAQTIMKSGKGGFGIGLCTSREFARSMGGDLTVHANKPNGCIFTLELPFAGFMPAEESSNKTKG